ncbi:MAG: DNA polymerase III subunit alpha [Polyangiaceae bacterium]|nr:DNA polymerase III subunit alpha [Polyangiaceae bacterium]MCB9608475.1 DNA polymerase III subunit alpha [Polyangiaceae bacterium]
MQPEFVHLHVHTQFSFLVSTVKLGELAPAAKARGMNAVAMTDHANLFGAIRHYKACRALEMTPIIGCELNVARDGTERVDHLVCLASSLDGYKNLVELSSLSYTKSAATSSPSITLETLAQHSKGLIGLSACLGGVAAQRVMESGPEAAEPVLGTLRDIFDPGAFYVELQNHGLPENPVVNDILSSAAKRMGLSVVASNDVHFLDESDGEAHLYLDCIRQGKQYAEVAPHHHNSFEMYLKTPEQMAEAFRGHPEALRNTLEVAEKCAGLELQLGKPMLPNFPLPEGFDTASYFRKVAEDGLRVRFEELCALGVKFDEAEYWKRLEFELNIILKMDYPGYFLIVWDFIREAKERGIPVGPGRGSGAGSLVAYAMRITSLDPIPYALLFERFLNPERVSMPDFDVDFCMAKRDRVIRYVAQKYGVESVGQIATFQNLKARSVIKDVARSMGFPAPEAQRIASLIPEKGPGQTYTITEALDVEPKLKVQMEENEQVAELIKQATKLEGLTRHAGMHAAGVVISEGPLSDHVPTFDNDGNFVTQYDKDDVETAGLVKFDFLGLKTLTVIDIAERLVNARPDRTGEPLHLDSIPLTDQDAYTLMSSGETKGVFQLESDGMQQKVLRPLKPDCFEDVVAAVALYRPGPLGTGMLDDFIGGKHGRKAIRKLHPLIDDVLAPTYGVPVYQEQVMQIAQQLSGYTLGGADLLRRAMGKKKASEMERQKAIFIEGAEKNGVDPEQAKSIFEEIEGFASYGFNKSHSAAYALITYQTAYLKAHYPAEFFAALLTADKDKIDKVVRTVDEARGWGVSVLPPDVNASALDFTVVYAHPQGRGPKRGPGKLRDPYGPQIRFGLGAIRGVGEAALESVFEAREAGGPFRDLFDFAQRVDAKRLNKGVLEALVQCGAFDSTLDPIGISRARAFAAIDRALERSRAASRDREAGQETLFGLFDAAKPEASTDQTLGEYPPAEEWDRVETLRREKAALGWFVSGHPLDRYGVQKLARLAQPVADLKKAEQWSAVTVAGMVEGYAERIFRQSGQKAAFFDIEDLTGKVKAKLKGDLIESFAHVLTSGEAVLVSGKVSFPITDEPSDELEPTILVNQVAPLSSAVLGSTRQVTVRLKHERTSEAQLSELSRLLRESPGSCGVELVIGLPDGAEAVMALDQLSVEPTDAMLSGLEKVFRDTVVELR